MDVDIWSDIACPWCYIGKRRFERALAEFDHADELQITWHSFQLDPGLPDHYDGSEVEYLSERKGWPPDQIRQMFTHVTEQAAGEGLDYDFDHLVVANSAKAHELLHLAKAHGVAGAVKETLLAAHFERGQDTGDIDTLVHLGTSAGLDETEIRAALRDGTYRDAVRADIDEAARLGIQAVPFFVLDRRYGVSGAQSPALFTEALEKAWADTQVVQLVGDAGAAQADEADGCGPDGCAI